jgi:hypothetical protein
MVTSHTGASHASSAARTGRTSASSSRHSAIMQPPPPPPVSLAPSAPALRAAAHSTSVRSVESSSDESSAWFMFMSWPRALTSLASRASAALRTSAAMASKVFSLASGLRSCCRATDATMSFVGVRSPVSASNRRRGARMCTGFTPAPRTYTPAPPRAAIVWSMPDGLP